MPACWDDDADRVCKEDDFLRHWLADATVLDPEGVEVYVTPAPVRERDALSMREERHARWYREQIGRDE